MNIQPAALNPAEADRARHVAVMVLERKIASGTPTTSAWDEYEATKRIIAEMECPRHV